SAVAVAHWGTVITTPEVSAESARVEIEVSVLNSGSERARVDVTTLIYALPAGQDAPSATDDPVARTSPVTVAVRPGTDATAAASVVLERPALWGPPPTQRPHRYLAITTLHRGEEMIDRVRTLFGVRRIEFDADEGLLVNGERIRIQGVNNHHDLGALGAAFHRRAAERQLEILQEMGANAQRTAHNPPAPALLDLTDRMGLLESG